MKILFSLIFLSFCFLVFSNTGCSSGEKKTETNKIEHAPKPLAPGTALVEAKVISVIEDESGVKCKVFINKSMGTGMATPAMGSGVEKEFLLSRYLISKGTKVEEGKTYEMSLRYSGPTQGEEKNSYWQITSIK